MDFEYVEIGLFFRKVPIILFYDRRHMVFIGMTLLNLVLTILLRSQEKKILKEEKLKLEEKYMWAIVDGVKEKV